MDGYGQLTWLCRLVTVPLLATGLWGRPAALYLAIAVCGAQVLHFTWRKDRFTAFPVPMPIVYLGLLVVGLWEPLKAIHWLQLIATVSLVVGSAGPLREPLESGEARRDPRHVGDVLSTAAS